MTRKEKEMIESLGLKIGDRIKIMTRKEKELKILEALELEVGDEVIIIYGSDNTITNFTTVVEKETKFCLEGKEGTFGLDTLLLEDWVKVPSLLKGKKCKDFKNCQGCPFEYRCVLWRK